MGNLVWVGFILEILFVINFVIIRRDYVWELEVVGFDFVFGLEVGYILCFWGFFLDFVF